MSQRSQMANNGSRPVLNLQVNTTTAVPSRLRPTVNISAIPPVRNAIRVAGRSAKTAVQAGRGPCARTPICWQAFTTRLLRHVRPGPQGRLIAATVAVQVHERPRRRRWQGVSWWRRVYQNSGKPCGMAPC